jgi:hypothetical protein
MVKSCYQQVSLVRADPSSVRHKKEHKKEHKKDLAASWARLLALSAGAITFGVICWNW